VIFFPGLHQPADAKNLPRCMVSVNRLRERVSDFAVGEWIMDSGAFSTIAKLGYYPEEEAAYAAQIKRWSGCGRLLAAVAQDYMCEDAMLAKTWLRDVFHHQNFTTGRYGQIRAELDDLGCSTYLMPVLQGRTMGDYARHITMYEDSYYGLPRGAWVGVGSVCKRNSDPIRLWMILDHIKDRRPDLKLHGFGVKWTSLTWEAGDRLPVADLLHSADSMAWSFAARYEGRNGNDWREAEAFASRIEALTTTKENTWTSTT
jgi:hypothetical protein